MDLTSKKKWRLQFFLNLEIIFYIKFHQTHVFSFWRKTILESCSAILKITLWKRYFENENSDFVQMAIILATIIKLGRLFFKMCRILPAFMWVFRILNNLNSFWDKLLPPLNCEKWIFFYIFLNHARNRRFSTRLSGMIKSRFMHVLK